MGRISIYVDDALQSRMDAFGEGINWSRIAQDAFTRVIAVRTALAETVDQEGIDRLRYQRNAYGEFHRADGIKLGRDWALNNASPEELKRVAEVPIGVITDSEHAQLLLYRAVFDSEPIKWRQGGKFFENFLHERHPFKERVEGFIEGAGRVLQQLES